MRRIYQEGVDGVSKVWPQKFIFHKFKLIFRTLTLRCFHLKQDVPKTSISAVPHPPLAFPFLYPSTPEISVEWSHETITEFGVYETNVEGLKIWACFWLPLIKYMQCSFWRYFTFFFFKWSGSELLNLKEWWSHFTVTSGKILDSIL